LIEDELIIEHNKIKNKSQKNKKADVVGKVDLDTLIDDSLGIHFQTFS
jgi:hypothetical protein